MSTDPEQIFSLPFFKDPDTISEMAANEKAEIFNAMRAGFIPATVARTEMDTVEQLQEKAGDGWFERYGSPPPELRAK
jgi:hypothetical protein